MHVVVVGGSDAGIEAARRCRELAPTVDVGPLQQAAHAWAANLRRKEH